MPKGDRFRLKADPEDGTTPIANLLLEAVAMAKISGLQKGAILYLWRRTYGWVDGDKRVKERKIALSEWLHALDSTKAKVSTALSNLEGKNIIKRRTTDQWGGYYYSINTDIASWNSDCINLTRLSEMVTVADFGTVAQNRTVAEKGNSSPNRQQLPETATPSPTPKKRGLPKTATVAQKRTEQLPKTEPPTLYKETLNKDKEKKDDKKLSSPTGEKVKEVFGFLDKERGYRPPKRKAEAASIMRMLKTHTVEQITYTWKYLKQDKFWADKELLMMSVENQIGAIVSKKKKENVRW